MGCQRAVKQNKIKKKLRNSQSDLSPSFLEALNNLTPC